MADQISYLKKCQLLFEDIQVQITLDTFRIIHQLGQGGFSRVFKVTSKITNKNYAMKIIEKERILKSQKLLQLLINEIEILEWVNHPNITRLLYYFENDENFYLIFELSNRGNLYKLIWQTNGLSQEQSIKIMKQIIKGLKYLHDFQPSILHWDLKPENILLFEDDIYKLTDFGCSSFLEEERRTICGTLDYIAPEIILQQEQTDWTDIWQLGVLFYEMLNGQTPFENLEETQSFDIKRNILQNQIFFHVKIDSQIKELIILMLNKDQYQRPSIDQIIQNPLFNDNKGQIQYQSFLQKILEFFGLKTIQKQVEICPWVSYKTFDSFSQDKSLILEVTKIIQENYSNIKGLQINKKLIKNKNEQNYKEITEKSDMSSQSSSYHLNSLFKTEEESQEEINNYQSLVDLHY